MKRIVASLLAIAVFAFSGLAIADISVKDGGGTSRTIFNFVCFTTKLCNATVLVDSTGTEIVPATHADATAAVPCLNATAWTTNTYTTGQTNPLNCDLHGAPWHDLGAVNGIAVLTGTGATGTGAQRVTIATDQATNAGAALVKGGVGVVNGGSFYVTIAASQTAQVLQSSSGATGDYLSHCVLQPTTTAAGTMTILDNATTVFTFTTGTLSNLAPISIPVGSISVSGAWKVTTGANETATCFGKFS